MSYFSLKKTPVLILLVLVLILSGCQAIQKNSSDPEALLKDTLDNMKALESYESSVTVKIAPEEPEADGGSMRADIVYHKEPFQYSNLQELAMTSGDSDESLDKIELKNYVLDGVAYMYQSITALWVNESDKELIGQVEELANIFDSFNPEDFSELRIKEDTKDKVVIAGMTKNSDFLYNLMQNFDESVSGAFEMVITKDKSYMEKLTYTPNIETEDGHVNHEIIIEAKSFNEAPEIVIPEEAKAQ